MNIISVSLAILCAAVVFIVLTPNRWTYKRIPPYHKEYITPQSGHDALMDAIRKSKR